jgi:hypothetical protein
VAKRKGFRIPAFSFSWKRAIGLTAARQKLARATGVPTTRQGMKRKFGFFGLGLLGSMLMPRRTRVAESSAGSSSEPASIGGCIVALLAIGAVSLLCCGGVGILPSLMTVDAPAPRPTVNNQRQVAMPAQSNMHPATVADAETIRPSSSIDDPPASSARASIPPIGVADLPIAVTPPPTTTTGTRTWASADGKFATEAEFLYMGGDKVKLRKPDGSEISVPLERLSETDRRWIQEYRRSK